MRSALGLLALVVVLAIIGVVGRKQMQRANGVAVRGVGAASEAAALSGNRGAAVADPSGLATARQAREVEERARAETTRALQQGADRNAQADP